MFLDKIHGVLFFWWYLPVASCAVIIFIIFIIAYWFVVALQAHADLSWEGLVLQDFKRRERLMSNLWYPLKMCVGRAFICERVGCLLRTSYSQETKGPLGIRAGDQGGGAHTHTNTPRHTHTCVQTLPHIALSQRPLGEFSGKAWREYLFEP